jgi:hypothetical protein
VAHHTANVRLHETARDRPVDLLGEDTAAMHALPPVLPDVRFHHDLRLPADHWIRHQGVDYSVHPTAVGRRVHVAADISTVVVTCVGEDVARHERSFASRATVTDAAHDEARKALRGRTPAQFDDLADTEVAGPDLADYDRALGVVA